MRFEISQCIGCGSMQVEEICEVCDYERLELLDSTDYDALSKVVNGRRAELARASDVIAEFAADRISSAEAAAKLTANGREPDAPAPAEDQPVPIWRCRRCGAIDAMQECLGICIWRTFEWIRAEEVRQLRSELDALDAQLQAQMKLRTQLVHSRPRAGYELQHLRALQGAAKDLLAGTLGDS